MLAGVILPVRLENSISSDETKPGQAITTRIMQNVPLPDRGRIRAGSRVVGRLVDLIPPGANQGARVKVRFDSLVVAKWTILIQTSLRDIASAFEVEDAQVPKWGADRGTSPAAHATVQIGGEVVYRGGGHVMRRGQVVGEPVNDGVRGRVRDSADGKCRDEGDGNDALEALWVFSSDACGVYGLASVGIVHAGRTDPIGEITLAANHGELHIRSGAGMLLRVNPVVH